MKIIIKDKFFNHAEIEIFIDPNKTTISYLAELYLDELHKRYVYSIEPSKYRLNMDVNSSHFIFYISGKRYAAHKYGQPHILLSNIFTPVEIKEDCCKVFVSLLIYGMDNYCVNSHLTFFSRVDAFGKQLTDLQASTLKGFIDLK